MNDYMKTPAAYLQNAGTAQEWLSGQAQTEVWRLQNIGMAQASEEQIRWLSAQMVNAQNCWPYEQNGYRIITSDKLAQVESTSPKAETRSWVILERFAAILVTLLELGLLLGMAAVSLWLVAGLPRLDWVWGVLAFTGTVGFAVQLTREMSSAS